MVPITIKGHNNAYVVEAKWGWDGWLPRITEFLPYSIWWFIFEYTNRFVELVKIHYGIDLELASDDQVLKFFIDTGLIEVRISKGQKLTDYAIKKIMRISREYRKAMIDESNLI